MSPIKDYKVYNAGMKRALYDKLFFVDKINPKYIVDFGCADGQLMNEIQPYFPEAEIVGVDNNQDMRDLNTDHQVFADLSEVPRVQGSALILSSVLHELYSYSSITEINKFWDMAKEFDYLVIRDMAIPGQSMYTTVSESRVNVLRDLYTDQVQDFEEIWGDVKLTQNFIHFLLKYKYIENWEREVKENYLANTKEQLILRAAGLRHVVYEDHYVLPYLQDLWNDELGINVSTPTHLKLITKKA